MKAIISIISVAVAAAAPADLIYDNGLADNANNGTTGLLADNFTITSPSLVNEVEWIGVYGYDGNYFYFVPLSEDAIVQIYADTGSGPAATPTYDYHIDTVTRNDAGTMSSWPAYSWTVSIPDTVLAPGSYFLSVRNVNMEPPDYWGTDPSAGTPWHWGYSDQFNGDSYSRPSESDSWTQGTADFRFAVFGQVVPEPSTLTVLMTGLGALVACARNGLRTRGSSLRVSRGRSTRS